MAEEGLEQSLSQKASAVITAFSGRWTVRVLLAMTDGPIRTSDLCRAIPDASKKMLIESLQRLERSGIVQRRDMSSVVKHVEYEIRDAVRKQTLDLLKMFSEFPLI
jgi:DNA-binding HxlR family transcriptional regulator